MNRWRKMIAGALAVGIVAGIFGFQPESTAQVHGGHGGGMAATGSQTSLVRTEKAQTQPIAKDIELTGSVVATRIARLASPGEGPVKNCQWREGDRVAEGDSLVEIGREKAVTADLVSARQLLHEQRQELERIETLVAAGAISGASLDASRSKYENAKAMVAKAEQHSADYLIKAPWPGVISKVLIKDGDYIAPRMPLIEMFDPASMVIRFAVPEAQAMHIRNDMKVMVRLDAYPGQTWQGMISRIYPELDIRTRTRIVEAMLTFPVTLIPGMFARLTVEQERMSAAITVPTAALVTTPHGHAVFVVEEGKAVRRKVATGIEAGGMIQILSGIQAGAEIVTAGHERLKDGGPVRIAGVEPAEQIGQRTSESKHMDKVEKRSDHHPGQSGHQSDSEGHGQ